MPAYYPLLALGSMLLFAWLGRRFAGARNRNRLVWGLAGAAFPPALLILLLLRPRTADEAAEDDPDEVEA